MVYPSSKITRTAVGISLFVLAALLSSCGNILQPSPVDLTGDPLGVGEGVWFFDLDGSNPSDQIRARVDVGDEPKDVYLVLSNPTGSFARVSSLSSPSARRSLANQVAPAPVAPPQPEDEYEPGRTSATDWQAPALTSSRNMTDATNSRALASAGSHSVGAEAEFFTDSDPRNNVTAVLATRVNDAGTGTALEIWVESSEWQNGSGAVNSTMIGELAATFLKAGPNNDIYDWVTAMLGDEWGSTPYSNLITNRDTITILLHNMQNNGPGGTVGYYWSKDAFRNETISFSNERIMFYIDSESFEAASGATWEITDRWPAIVVSTLAHEFQHMIHFYQRYVKRGATTDTWLNEMMSLMTEDLVAQKLGIAGPRGVDPIAHADGSAGTIGNNSGRLPRYNRASNESLTEWGASGSTLDSYSLTYSYGAYLARNFGGADLLRAMMESSSSDAERVVQEALSTQGYANGTHEELLWRWGVSTLRSQHVAEQPFQLNPGRWMSDAEFSLGSINHFNYYGSGSYGPIVHEGAIDSLELKPYSKALYKVGSGLTGEVSLECFVEAGVDFAIVAN
ncbi:MAG: M30 family zinc metallopeptidase [Spirochaetota bacterium]